MSQHPVASAAPAAAPVREPAALSRRADPLPSARSEPAQSETSSVEPIARAAVRLAALGPRLAKLAGQMDLQADAQARHAEQVATTTRRLAENLSGVVARLREASGNVGDVMADIARIADQTRILSINASIEAARAGAHGRTFHVVAQEVQQLADQTRTLTRVIEGRVRAIKENVGHVAALVADGATGDHASVTVETVKAGIEAIAGSAESQRAGAKLLREAGDQANRGTEELLLAVGRFRLAVHREAEAEVRSLLPLLGSAQGRASIEQAMADWLAGHPGFELLYVTNIAGVQLTANFGWRDGAVAGDEATIGHSWQERPWFRDALRDQAAVAVSNIYRSTATGDFCFTLSAVVRDPAGKPRGVFGADVNFEKLVDRDPAR